MLESFAHLNILKVVLPGILLDDYVIKLKTINDFKSQIKVMVNYLTKFFFFFWDVDSDQLFVMAREKNSSN